MRNIVSTFTVLACVLALPTFLPAQGSDSAAGKVAVLNLQVAIASTQAGKLALSDLQKKYAPKQQDLQQQEKNIEQLQNRLQNQSAMLTDDERYNLGRQLDEDQRHLKEAQEDDNADFQADQTEAVRGIAEKMQKLIAQYAQQHGFALVIGAGEQSTPVYYASKAVDITSNLVSLYDSAYPVATASNSGDKPPVRAAKGDRPKH